MSGYPCPARWPDTIGTAGQFNECVKSGFHDGLHRVEFDSGGYVEWGYGGLTPEPARSSAVQPDTSTIPTSQGENA